MTPTAEQLAVLSAATETKDNLLISALAGAAKTTTLVMIAEALPKTEILCLAFNKRIAEEMQQRLPGNCEAKTLNGLGHSAWAKTIGRFARVDTSKTYRLLSDYINELPAEHRGELFENFGDVMRIIDTGKTSGYLPDNTYPDARPLMRCDEFFSSLDEEPSEVIREAVCAVTIRSAREAWKGTIDFSDQLLMPTIFQAIFPRFPLILVDEAQDLSALNHAMLRKIARRRIIAVGDERQSIYGFRGAHQDSMTVLRESFSMTTLPLSISFRCSKAVVHEAQWRAPHMTYPNTAKDGSVTTLSSWSVSDLPNSDVAIICRNNAPLFSLAIRLLRSGRYPQIVGTDIGKALLRQMKKFGPAGMPSADALIRVDEWLAQKLTRARDHQKFRDQADCMRVFLNEAPTLGDSIAYAEHLLSVSGPIQLMTGHKSKGLEFQHVFILDRDLLLVKNYPQERNLLYVMQTRAKTSLTYITSEGFNDDTTAT